jgi:hypothetical protein
MSLRTSKTTATPAFCMLMLAAEQPAEVLSPFGLLTDSECSGIMRRIWPPEGEYLAKEAIMKFAITWTDRHGGSAGENAAAVARMLEVFGEWSPPGHQPLAVRRASPSATSSSLRPLNPRSTRSLTFMREPVPWPRPPSSANPSAS